VSVSVNDCWDWAYARYTDPTLAASLGFDPANVFKGDQLKIRAFPTLCIEPGPKRRNMYGAQRQMETRVTLLFIIYVGKVQDPETNQAQATTYGELIEADLHEHAQVGGNAIHSYVTELDPGYATRAGDVLRACRLTFDIEGQEILPMSAP